MKAGEDYFATPSQKELAADVLKQAAQDLRRFHGGTTALERELYRDAYSWLISNEEAWPFSFLNVCQLLSLAPATVREELLGDQSLSAFSYHGRRCGRGARKFHIFFSNTFTSRRNANGIDRAELAPTVR